MQTRFSQLLALTCCSMWIGTAPAVADEVPATKADATQPMPPSAEPETPKTSLADVRAIPIFDVALDVNATKKLRAFLKPQIDESLMDDIIVLAVSEGMFGREIDAKTQLFRFEGRVTRPAVEYYGDLVMPETDQLMKSIEAEDDFRKLEEDVYESDGTLIVVEQGHMGFLYGEQITHTDDDIARLRAMIRRTIAKPPRKACFISSAPRAIGRSALKPELAALRAQLSTEAQRRDDDKELEYLARTMWQRFQISLFDAFFRDTESIEYSMKFDENERSLVVELEIRTVKGTELDQYIGRIGSTRNRCMQYLHPDQIGFVSATIPLSDDLAKPLPKVAGMFADVICGLGGSKRNLAAGIEQSLQSVADERTVGCLFQAVPTSEASTAFFTVVPLQDADSLQTPLIQLASAVSSNVPQSVGEVGGWPVYEFVEPAKDLHDEFSGDAKSYVVTTDECFAWMIGREDDLQLLESVLKHEFEATPMSQRFQRTVFAAATTLNPLQSFDELIMDDAILGSVTEEDDESDKGPGHMQMFLQTAPHEFTLTARFDQDALLAGISLVNTSVELLSEIAEYVYD